MFLLVVLGMGIAFVLCAALAVVVCVIVRTATFSAGLDDEQLLASYKSKVSPEQFEEIKKRFEG